MKGEMKVETLLKKNAADEPSVGTNPSEIGATNLFIMIWLLRG